MSNAKDYTYEAHWSDEDGAFLCRVVDFPVIAAHGDTPTEAIAEAEGAVRASLQVLAAKKQPPPTPRSARTSSGRRRT